MAEIHQETNISKSVAFAIVGAAFLALMAFFAKLATASATNAMIVFFRFAVTGVYVLGAIQIKRLRGQRISLKTHRFGMHVLRAIAATGAMYSLYYALRYIPLVNANLLTMTYPLFAMLLATLFFKEKNGRMVWLSAVVAFVGIVLILRPVNSEMLNPAALIGLFSGFCAAVSILGIRELSKYEHTYTIMFYYTLFSLSISFALVIFDWHNPNLHTLWLLLFVGIFGMLYQEFLTRALAYAPARIPAALMYFSIIFSSVLGVVFWNQTLDYLTWLGIFLVCAGNILVITFETHKKYNEDEVPCERDSLSRSQG